MTSLRPTSISTACTRALQPLSREKLQRREGETRLTAPRVLERVGGLTLIPTRKHENLIERTQSKHASQSYTNLVALLVPRSAWLTEKKKEWGKRRCFKSELGTVDELKRIPQVEGRRTFKRGNISADMPIQKLVDLVEMDYRNIESSKIWVEDKSESAIVQTESLIGTYLTPSPLHLSPTFSQT